MTARNCHCAAKIIVVIQRDVVGRASRKRCRSIDR
jgi:hypothetical protein